MTNANASKFDSNRRWLDRWIRDTVDRLLLPFHGEHRIRRIVLGV